MKLLSSLVGLLLLAFSATGVKSGLVVQIVDLAPRDCSPVQWVVVNSHLNEIYNQTIHGDGSPELPLRLFNKLPNGCTGNLLAKKGLEFELSTRNDIQLRDTRTDVSKYLYKRGFFSWAASIWKFTPWAAITGVALGVIGTITCALDWAGASLKGKAACIIGKLLLGLRGSSA